MDIIANAAKALSPIARRGISVAQGWYDENNKKTHITLWLLSDTPDGHSDDDTEVENQIVQVNIWSERDQVELKNEIKKLMKSADFIFIEAHDEYEAATRIFDNAMRFTQISEIETEE